LSALDVSKPKVDALVTVFAFPFVHMPHTLPTKCLASLSLLQREQSASLWHWRLFFLSRSTVDDYSTPVRISVRIKVKAKEK
jgi:hypothetical protein